VTSALGEIKEILAQQVLEVFKVQKAIKVFKVSKAKRVTKAKRAIRASLDIPLKKQLIIGHFKINQK
jgi:hypothetical protein